MLNFAKFKGSGLPLSYHDVLPNGSRFVRSICMASPSPREKWRFLLSLLRRAAVLCAAVYRLAAAQSCCAVCCGYRLAAAQSCCAVRCGYRLGALLSPHAMSPGSPPASAGIPHPGLPNTKISSLGRGTPKNGRPIHSVLAGPS